MSLNKNDRSAADTNDRDAQHVTRGTAKLHILTESRKPNSESTTSKTGEYVEPSEADMELYLKEMEDYDSQEADSLFYFDALAPRRADAAVSSGHGSRNDDSYSKFLARRREEKRSAVAAAES
ncbi:hypothetical protein [Rhizobium terrae]|uniref:hypothetical protein n=1 Tax=Rhizobium terrae TaxID=2171756 RepID=UPI000E3ED926|nr:hypothetical protein [Rhizobium terrae]